MMKYIEHIFYILLFSIVHTDTKILRGHLYTPQNWAFLARFCFLTQEGKFRYDFIIGGDPNIKSNVNLLLYYDAPDQWPSVYPSNKSCQKKQAILSIERGQIVPLSASRNIAPISGCVVMDESWTKVRCTSYREFRSSRPRWWFIVLADCSSQNGLNITYDMSLTNGPPGSFWKEHFSADEFWLLPLSIAAGSAYIILISFSVYVALQLRLRRLLHITYKIFMLSMIFEFIGICNEIYSLAWRGATGFDAPATALFGNIYEGCAESLYTLLLILMALGYTVTKSVLPGTQIWRICWFMSTSIILQLSLFTYQSEAFDPGLVLYIYESPPGFCLLALKLLTWVVFCFCCFRTCKRTVAKAKFYAALSSLGSAWFLCHPLTVLAITIGVDKWVRESVVKGCTLWIIFLGHTMFLYVTRPAGNNKHFPFHIRTCQVVPIAVGQNHNYEPRRAIITDSVFIISNSNVAAARPA